MLYPQPCELRLYHTSHLHAEACFWLSCSDCASILSLRAQVTVRRMLPVVTVVPFDWPRFLRNAAPSPFFAEFAAARNTSRLPVDAGTDPTSTMTAKPPKDALLHQVSKVSLQFQLSSQSGTQ